MNDDTLNKSEYVARTAPNLADFDDETECGKYIRRTLMDNREEALNFLEAVDRSDIDAYAQVRALAAQARALLDIADAIRESK